MPDALQQLMPFKSAYTNQNIHVSERLRHLHSLKNSAAALKKVVCGLSKLILGITLHCESFRAWTIATRTAEGCACAIAASESETPNATRASKSTGRNTCEGASTNSSPTQE